MPSSSQDAYGHEVFDYFSGKIEAREIVERDDGFVNAGAGPRLYFSRYEEWSPHERAALRLARGRVLDVGCGVGRHALHLQNNGLEVLGVDLSPLAVRVCNLRGLRNTRVASITGLGPELGKFDTVLMLGNNFGLFGSFQRARLLLRRFLGITNPKARIIAESLDIYRRPLDLFHKQYHERNRRLGRMPGQVRIRVRYRRFATAWFDYLLVSKKEMKQLLNGTGWSINRFFDSRGPTYIAIIERE